MGNVKREVRGILADEQNISQNHILMKLSGTLKSAYEDYELLTSSSCSTEIVCKEGGGLTSVE